MKIGLLWQSLGGGSDSSVTSLSPGFYDDNNVMLASWGTLVADYGLTIEKNYTNNPLSSGLPHFNSEGSGYYVITNNTKLKNTTKVVLPDTVDKVGEKVFYGLTQLKTVYISSSVTNIGYDAFRDENITTLIVDKNNTTYDSRDNCNAIINSTTNELVLGCKSSTVPNGVTSIGRNAFYTCYGLKFLELPDSVVSIGTSAFHHCNDLKQVIIPDSVKTFNNYAFANCESLESINIPYGVSTIGVCGFIGCSSLVSVIIPNSVKTIQGLAFSGCSSLKSITIPDSVTTFSRGAFQGCKSLSTIYIPISVSKITRGGNIEPVFLNCSPNLKIYCGASEKQSGWDSDWNYYNSEDTLEVIYGVTRTEYENNYK